MTFLRSAVFFVWFALVSTLMSLAALPSLVLDRKVIVFVSRSWSRAVLWGLKAIAGLDYEIRGPVPPRGVLVASKHMSMWDTIALYLLLDDPAVVVKRELLRVPFYGWYAWKAGVIAIDRDAGARALKRMIDGARAAIARGQAILIFPEGHRMAPHASPDYKPGVAALYSQLDVACVPVALNSGLFWTGPLGFLKKRGRVVVQFLEPIPAGLRPREFLKTLEARIESATAVIVAEGETILQRNATGTPAIVRR
ncbi:MAG TPA: lysophospholipid acyltransferase family protein [Rhizomicrobium sp.]|nr:lysophospholipid acyltransferase family protein [Rhizomicrobium sp.]